MANTSAIRQQAAQATYKLSSSCSTTATKKAYRNENIQLFLNDMTEEKNPWQLHAPEACNLLACVSSVVDRLLKYELTWHAHTTHKKNQPTCKPTIQFLGYINS